MAAVDDDDDDDEKEEVDQAAGETSTTGHASGGSIVDSFGLENEIVRVDFFVFVVDHSLATSRTIVLPVFRDSSLSSYKTNDRLLLIHFSFWGEAFGLPFRWRRLLKESNRVVSAGSP